MEESYEGESDDLAFAQQMSEITPPAEIADEWTNLYTVLLEVGNDPSGEGLLGLDPEAGDKWAMDGAVVAAYLGDVCGMGRDAAPIANRIKPHVHALAHRVHDPSELLAALKLVKYISSDGPQIAWHKGTGYFPVRKTAMDKLKTEGWFDSHPNYLVAFNQLLDSPSNYNTQGALLGVFPQVRKLIETGVQKVYAGNMTVKQMLDDAAAQTDKLMKDWNDLNG